MTMARSLPTRMVRVKSGIPPYSAAIRLLTRLTAQMASQGYPRTSLFTAASS